MSPFGEISKKKLKNFFTLLLSQCVSRTPKNKHLYAYIWMINDEKINAKRILLMFNSNSIIWIWLYGQQKKKKNLLVTLHTRLNRNTI